MNERARGGAVAALPPSQMPAALAKGALRRLAQARLEPTPENFARAYGEEADAVGVPTAAAAPAAASAAEPSARQDRQRAQWDRLWDRLCVLAAGADDASTRQRFVDALGAGDLETARAALERMENSQRAFAEQWSALVERAARAVATPSRQWTPARRRESFQRVLAGSRSDLRRLQQRLQSLVNSWDTDAPPEDESLVDEFPDAGERPIAAAAPEAPQAASAPHRWPEVTDALQGTVCVALPPADPRAMELADELGALAARVAQEGTSTFLVEAVEQACERARRILQHRHRLVDELAVLCRELGRSLTDTAEEDTWVRGQGEALQAHLTESIESRSVRAATVLLSEIRVRQGRLRVERAHARDALKSMIRQMLEEVAALDEHTDRFTQSLGQHARAVETADSLEGLASAVQSLLADSRSVQHIVQGTRARLQGEHARAVELEDRVRALESELRRLSDEATTDALTQIANRRGLQNFFDTEVARIDRQGPDAPPLSLALIDIDNFKKLNDSLGHAAGDEALKNLAASVRERLRQGDALARFGGEEFVVVMPATGAEQGQELLTRLQRSLTSALFMHDDREVFVTFSAGVTEWRRGEPLPVALERADEALYEAKRTGKNRTCRA
ncbi:MAG: diguanylate cyclase domain-containing protein [Rubrivivax sp.]|jgi:diguanylate cyclase